MPSQRFVGAVRVPFDLSVAIALFTQATSGLPR